MRLLVAVCLPAILFAWEEATEPYGKLAWVAVAGTIAYSAFAFLVTASGAKRPPPVQAWVRWGISAADATVLVVLAGITGTATSLYAPLLLLAVISLSIRFDLGRAVAVTAAVAVVFGALTLAVPEPARPAGERISGALWWALLLLLAAVLTATTSERVAEALAGRAQAEAETRAEHRRLEEERKLRQRFESLEQARRDFLHAVAHDFRTPITSLEGLARVLRHQQDLDDEQRRHAFQLIENHAHHVASLLVSVREVALTESLGPDRSLSLSDVFFSEVVKNAAAAVGLPAERLRIFIDPALTVIRTDADKTQRIVTNLLENASRHAPPGTRIDVELVPRDDSIELSVLDRGPGMPDEAAGKAFDKFFGFGERRGSSGLGMWIVAQLADALGGKVEASQRAGGGLVVRITQPLIAPARRSRSGQ